MPNFFTCAARSAAQVKKKSTVAKAGALALATGVHLKTVSLSNEVNTMSDFQDFLKRRLASVAIGEFKPGTFTEVRHLYEQATATYKEGFQGAYLFQEPGTDRGVSVIFWDSLEDMDANQGEEHAAILKQMAPLFKTPPQMQVYELVCEIKPESK
jgi:heme-degrading monooxygenase HmoA